MDSFWLMFFRRNYSGGYLLALLLARTQLELSWRLATVCSHVGYICLFWGLGCSGCKLFFLLISGNLVVPLCFPLSASDNPDLWLSIAQDVSIRLPDRFRGKPFAHEVFLSDDRVAYSPVLQWYRCTRCFCDCGTEQCRHNQDYCYAIWRAIDVIIVI